MSEPSLTPDDVRKVARLSRLALTEEQVEHYQAELSKILDFIERLRAVDLEGVEPMAHVGDTVNRFDDDVEGPTFSVEEVMRLAPDSMPPFIKVPRVLGEGGGA